MKKIIYTILVLAVLVGVFCFPVGAVESRISDIFPDANLAAEVAKQLGKSVDDVVVGEELATIEKIESVDANGDVTELEVTTLRGVENLTGLLSLRVTGRELTSADEIADLINLEVLSIKGASLTKIPPVIKLVNLKSLCLDDNKISKIEGLDSLIDLEYLSLKNNLIRKLEGVFNIGCSYTLGNNVCVSLRNNLIDDISLLETEGENSFVRSYDLSNNRISNLDSVDKYKGMRANFIMSSQDVFNDRILDPGDSDVLTIKNSSIIDYYNQDGTCHYLKSNQYKWDDIEGENGVIKYKCEAQWSFSKSELYYSVTVTQRWMRGFSKYDVTSDGYANVSDIITLKNQIMSGKTDLKHDIDNSNTIDVADMIALKEFIMNFDF